MAKKNHNFEWISFAIWTFSIIEEIASGYFYTWIQIVSRLDWLRGGGSLFYYGDHKVDYFHQDATWKALESIPSEKIIDGLRWKGGGGFDGVFIGYQNVTDMQKWSLKLKQLKPNPSQGGASNWFDRIDTKI